MANKNMTQISLMGFLKNIIVYSNPTKGIVNYVNNNDTILGIA